MPLKLSRMQGNALLLAVPLILLGSSAWIFGGWTWSCPCGGKSTLNRGPIQAP